MAVMTQYLKKFNLLIYLGILRYLRFKLLKQIVLNIISDVTNHADDLKINHSYTENFSLFVYNISATKRVALV